MIHDPDPYCCISVSQSSVFLICGMVLFCVVCVRHSIEERNRGTQNRVKIGLGHPSLSNC